MLSNQAYSGYGISVSGVGDVDKDGFSDVTVGAYRFSDDQSNEGSVFLYRGGLGGPSSAANWWAEGDKADSEFGFSSAPAGDVNKDGFQDLIIGAPQYKRDERIVLGRSFVYLGATAPADIIYTLHLPVIRR